jgi:hypothetical protein
MTETLLIICGAVFWITPPALLLVKFIWPSILSRSQVVVAIALLSWASLVLEEKFELLAEADCTSQLVETR